MRSLRRQRAWPSLLLRLKEDQTKRDSQNGVVWTEADKFVADFCFSTSSPIVCCVYASFFIKPDREAPGAIQSTINAGYVYCFEFGNHRILELVNERILLSAALEKVNATVRLHLSPYAEIIESKVQEKGSRVNAASLCKNATRFSRVKEEEQNCLLRRR